MCSIANPAVVSIDETPISTTESAEGMSLSPQCVGHLGNSLAQHVDKAIDLLRCENEGRGEHIEMGDRAHQHAPPLARFGDALADTDLGRKQLLCLFVGNILDAQHEMTAAHIPDDRQIDQLLEPALEVWPDLADMAADVLAFHDLDILESRRTAHGMAGIS